MYKQGKLYAFAATGFLYATIIVDLYRKLIGGNTESVRNMVYIFFFVLLVYDMIKTRRIRTMFAVLVVTLILYGFSMFLNPGYSSLYIPAIVFFISRLWPAYYIGRYTDDWDTLCKMVLSFSPIALVYALSLFIIPEIAQGMAYATIASNLAFVSMISLFASLYYKRLIWFPIALICLIPTFFYGTRVFFIGVTLSLFLVYIINSNKGSRIKRIVLIVVLIIVSVLFWLYSDAIFMKLYQWFPDSRTLKMLANGDLMDDSNRSSIYDRIYDHLQEKPLSMLGFLGDRIYLSHNGATVLEISSLFSHNCCLELCMQFGLPIGILLNIHFITKLIVALRRSFLVQYTINYVYVIILGAGLLNLMISASYLGEYTAWLLFGLAFNICNKSFFAKKQQ